MYFAKQILKPMITQYLPSVLAKGIGALNSRFPYINKKVD